MVHSIAIVITFTQNRHHKLSHTGQCLVHHQATAVFSRPIIFHSRIINSQNLNFCVYIIRKFSIHNRHTQNICTNIFRTSIIKQIHALCPCLNVWCFNRCFSPSIIRYPFSSTSLNVHGNAENL